MDPHNYHLAWILSSSDHHAIATSFFDEIHNQFHSAFLNTTYSTGRVGQHSVVVASKGPVTVTRNTVDVVDNVLQDFPSIRAGFLVSVNAVASQMGCPHVGDVVVGTRPNLQSGVIYFDAAGTRQQNRLVVTHELKHVPEHVAAAVEGLLNQEGRNQWLRTLDESSPLNQRMAYRGLIASSTQFLDDADLINRLEDENNILCFETNAASMKSQSLVVVAGIAGYAGSNQSCLASAEVCKIVISYLSCLIRHVNANAILFEVPLANYYEYQHFDLDRPGFRLISLGKGFNSEPVQYRLFQAYLPEEESNRADEVNKHNDLNIIPYEALSYCWGDSTRLCRTVLVDGKVLFVTEYLLDALKSLRRNYEDRILWVDALCIDQSNVRERGHQVGWMGKVYEYADNVLCWLGHVERTNSHLFSLLQSFKRDVPQVAWENWLPDDLRWSNVWKEAQSDRLIHDYASQLKCLMVNKWFSRVWILQEVANARKASLGCSEGWVDAKAFTMAPTLLGVKPDNQCQAVIDIMPGPLRKYSWWAQKSNICTLLWRFRGSQASDPRDRLYALLGLASDMKVKGMRMIADYTKTEEAVVRDITAFLFGDKMPLDTLGIASIVDLQVKIPNLSAIALENAVLSGASIEDVREFMQHQNVTSQKGALGI
ncbi:ankyrin repeat and sam domain containing protein 6 [Colletotrichum incanum]|uniref:Ankyrin repeat and sam domain containing protein 6 n=1 Tax=Colletotrichum incanum TaxID=1573173 RepID=A0A161VF79_COLIC|nr:ankyrin repeat and sam domain containing protein 6 [Colletotrichum incanum]